MTSMYSFSHQQPIVEFVNPEVETREVAGAVHGRGLSTHAQSTSYSSNFNSTGECLPRGSMAQPTDFLGTGMGQTSVVPEPSPGTAAYLTALVESVQSSSSYTNSGLPYTLPGVVNAGSPTANMSSAWSNNGQAQIATQAMTLQQVS